MTVAVSASAAEIGAAAATAASGDATFTVSFEAKDRSAAAAAGWAPIGSSISAFRGMAGQASSLSGPFEGILAWSLAVVPLD